MRVNQIYLAKAIKTKRLSKGDNMEVLASTNTYICEAFA